MARRKVRRVSPDEASALGLPEVKYPKAWFQIAPFTYRLYRHETVPSRIFRKIHIHKAPGVVISSH